MLSGVGGRVALEYDPCLTKNRNKAKQMRAEVDVNDTRLGNRKVEGTNMV